MAKRNPKVRSAPPVEADPSESFLTTIEILLPILEPGEDFAIVGPTFVASAQVTPSTAVVQAYLEVGGTVVAHGSPETQTGAEQYDFTFAGVAVGDYVLQVCEVVSSGTPVCASRNLRVRDLFRIAEVDGTTIGNTNSGVITVGQTFLVTGVSPPGVKVSGVIHMAQAPYRVVGAPVLAPGPQWQIWFAGVPPTSGMQTHTLVAYVASSTLQAKQSVGIRVVA